MEIANRIGSGRATLGVDGVSFVLDMASLALVSNPYGIAASVFASAWDLYFVTH